MKNRWIWRLVGIKRFVMLLLLFSTIQAVAIILAAKWLAELIVALFEGGLWSEQIGKAFAFLIVFLIRYLTVLLQQRIADRFAEKQGREIRKQLIEKLFQVEPIFAKREGTGKLVTLVQEGVEQFAKYLELVFPRMIDGFLIPLILWGYIVFLDVPSSLILAIAIPILVVFLILVGLMAQKKSEQQWASFRMLANHFVDSLRGLETLKFLGQSRAHGRSIEQVSNQYRIATMRTLRLAFLSTFTLEFFTMLSVASVAVGLGLRLIENEIPFVSALTILILAPEYFLPIQKLGADYHATLNGKKAGETIEAVLKQKTCTSLSTFPSSFTWTEKSTLQFVSIQVQYPEASSPSLDDISFHVKGFRKIGIVGASGAGKSTLIDVLAGFQHPTAGEIRVDGWNLPSLMDQHWRQAIAYIPQHPYLFHLTLMENIRFYRPEASRQEVEQAIKQSGLASFVEQLPQGLDEPIGNGGRMLSGGQEQRVALARAFLCDRPILLLDEPTAHLDIETEYELKKIMIRLFHNKLVLFATHRYHWLKEMDEVWVLDQGRLVEKGTCDELLVRRGRLYQLMMLQGASEDEAEAMAVASYSK